MYPLWSIIKVNCDHVIIVMDHEANGTPSIMTPGSSFVVGVGETRASHESGL
jgi:hypothetical protein